MREKEPYVVRRMVLWASVIPIAFMVFGFVAGVTYPVRTWSILLFLGLFTIAFLKVLNYAGDQLFKYVMGSKGEFKVWVILNEMYREGYRVINNLELKEGSDIDHVVVGPTGVWAIESKFIDGEIGISGDALTRDGKPFKKDFLRQTHAEAFAVRDYLKSKGFEISVKPLLVFSRQHAKVRFGESPTKGVYVIGSMYLRKIISDARHGKVLESEQVKKIAAVLDAANAEA